MLYASCFTAVMGGLKNTFQNACKFGNVFFYSRITGMPSSSEYLLILREIYVIPFLRSLSFKGLYQKILPLERIENVGSDPLS